MQPLGEGDRITLQRAIPGATILSFIQERDQKRDMLRQKTEDLDRDRPIHGVPMPDSPLALRIDSLSNEISFLNSEIDRLNRLIQSGLTALNIAREEELVSLVTEQFPNMFIERGKQIAIAELDQNKAIVEEESHRYGLNMCVDPAARQGLVRAVQVLLAQERQIQDLGQRLQTARLDIDMPSGGVPDPSRMSSSYNDVQRISEELERVARERDQRRQEFSLQYPILLQSNLDMAAIASGNEEQLNAAVGGRLTEISKNIDETKDNVTSGRLKIWNLHNIVEMAIQDLGIGSNPTLQSVINSHIQQEQSDETILHIALSALAITAGIIATVASGGVALAAGVVALGAGGYQLSEGVQTYLAESTASNIALDPQVADISRNEPELFWLVLDLAGVIFDAAQIVRAVNQLRNAAHALMSTYDIVEFGRVARQVLPAHAAERVIASATRQAGASASVSRTIEAVGNAFRHADMAEVAQHIERTAGKGFSKVIQRLQADGSFHPLTEDALTAVYGEKRAAEFITNERVLTYLGFYDPLTGHMFIRPGSLESVSTTVIHESIHYVRRSFGEDVANFVGEFEAYAAERLFLQRLAREAGEDAVPEGMRWLRDASDDRISAHVSSAYGYTIPGNIDSAQIVLDVIRRMNHF